MAFGWNPMPSSSTGRFLKMSNGIAGEQLKAIIERWERVDEERKALVEDQAEILKEAKGNGFDVKIIKKILALRKKSADARQEEAELLKLYADAIQLDLGL